MKNANNKLDLGDSAMRTVRLTILGLAAMALGFSVIVPTVDACLPVMHTLTVQITGGGSVALEPPVPEVVFVDPNGGAQSYSPGTVVSLEATPDSAYTFHHWEGALTGSDNPASITMNSSTTVRAVFYCIVGPYVESITRLDASPTTATSVRYQVTFTQSVTGVDAGDFVVTCLDGDLADLTVMSVTGTGSVYTVTVGTGSGDGELRLDLIDNDSIKASGGWQFSLGSSYMGGETYIVDRYTRILSIVPVGANPDCSSIATYLATFEEDVTGVTPDDFVVASETITGAYTCNVVPIDGSVYYVLVETGTGDGVLVISVRPDTDIVDLRVPPRPLGGLSNQMWLPHMEIDKPVLTITVQGSGTTDPPPGQHSYPCSHNPIVTAIPSEGWILDHWDGPVSMQENPATVLMYNNDTSLTAVFDLVPMVVSIQPLSAYTNQPSVDFTVTFNTNVTGVTTGDFDAFSDDGLTDQGVTLVSGGPSVYTVTVSTGNGEGTLYLHLMDDNTIQSPLSTPLGGAGEQNYTTGVPCVVDRTNPSVLSITRKEGSENPTNNVTVQYTVTFSEDVTGVDTGDFSMMAVGITGAAVTGVSGTGAVYTVTAGTGNGDGTLALKLEDDDTIKDAAQNLLGGAGEQDYDSGESFSVAKLMLDVTSTSVELGTVNVFINDVLQLTDPPYIVDAGSIVRLEAFTAPDGFFREWREGWSTHISYAYPTYEFEMAESHFIVAAFEGIEFCEYLQSYLDLLFPSSGNIGLYDRNTPQGSQGIPDVAEMRVLDYLVAYPITPEHYEVRDAFAHNLGVWNAYHERVLAAHPEYQLPPTPITAVLALYCTISDYSAQTAIADYEAYVTTEFGFTEAYNAELDGEFVHVAFLDLDGDIDGDGATNLEEYIWTSHYCAYDIGGLERYTEDDYGDLGFFTCPLFFDSLYLQWATWFTNPHVTVTVNLGEGGDAVTPFTGTAEICQYDLRCCPPDAVNCSQCPYTDLLFTAHPSAGYRFCRWDGNIPSNQQYDNPLNLAMSQNYTFEPVFVLEDAPIDFTATPTSGPRDPLTGWLAVAFEPEEICGNVTSWTWDFGDGSTDNDRYLQFPTHHYEADGMYTVSLRVTGPDFTAAKTKLNYIKVGKPAIVTMMWISESSDYNECTGTNYPYGETGYSKWARWDQDLTEYEQIVAAHLDDYDFKTICIVPREFGPVVDDPCGNPFGIVKHYKPTFNFERLVPHIEATGSHQEAFDQLAGAGILLSGLNVPVTVSTDPLETVPLLGDDLRPLFEKFNLIRGNSNVAHLCVNFEAQGSTMGSCESAIEPFVDMVTSYWVCGATLNVTHDERWIYHINNSLKSILENGEPACVGSYTPDVPAVEWLDLQPDQLQTQTITLTRATCTTTLTGANVGLSAYVDATSPWDVETDTTLKSQTGQSVVICTGTEFTTTFTLKATFAAPGTYEGVCKVMWPGGHVDIPLTAYVGGATGEGESEGEDEGEDEGEVTCPSGDCFERIIIGDIDGFGWDSGSVFFSATPVILSGHSAGNPPVELPANLDGADILKVGDYLPDIDHVGGAQVAGPSAEPADDWDNRTDELSRRYVTGKGFIVAPGVDFGSHYTDLTLSRSYARSQDYLGTHADPVPVLDRTLNGFPKTNPDDGISNLPGVDVNPPFVFDFYVEEGAVTEDTKLYLNMVSGDYDVSPALVNLTTAPPASTSITACFTKQPKLLEGEIQAAYLPLNGDILTCGTSGGAQSLTFADVFQWDPVRRMWHGYLEVRFIDPWSGSEVDPYLAIDFIELSVNRASLNCDGSCDNSGHFERFVIGDVDGFGWQDGKQFEENDPPLFSGNVEVATGEKIPCNLDGAGVLNSGDFLPDIDGSGGVDCSSETILPADYWDNRTWKERGSRYITGRGFTAAPDVDFGSEWTDITLGFFYTPAQEWLRNYSLTYPSDPDPVLDSPRVLCSFPTPSGRSATDKSFSDQPGNAENKPFIFDFYVKPFDIDPAKPLYFNMMFADYDVRKVHLELRCGAPYAHRARVQLSPQVVNQDGLIQAAFVELNNGLDIPEPEGYPYVNDHIDFYDIFHWEGNQWHAYLEARFLDAQDDSGFEPYTAFDFVELSSNLASTGIIRVPEDYATIQAAIDAASPRGATIYVQEGTYRENLDMKGKDIVLRSYFPDEPACVAATIINGDIDDDGTGDGPVITFQGSETRMCVVSGFTITKGLSSMGGGIYGAGCHAIIANNVITNNIANSGGGIASCSGEVRNNTINGNFAIPETGNELSGLGGGLFNCLTVYQNKICGNTAGYAGAGLHCQYAFHAVNNLVCDNQLTSVPADTSAGAGVHVPATDRNWRWLIAHNTLVNNTGNTSYVTNVSVPTGATVVNCIIRGACDPENPDGHDDKDLLLTIARNCNIEGCPDKSTVTSAPWNFGDNPEFLATGDDPYYIPVVSPCVNAGTNTNPPTITDILNRVRAAAPDVGAYECAGTVTSDYVYIQGPSEATVGDTVTLTAKLNPTLDPVPQDVSYQWKFNGENVGANSASLVINPVQLSHEGVYTVTATYNAITVVSNDFTLTVVEEDETDEDEAGVDGPSLQVDPFMLVLDNCPVGGSADGAFTVKNVGNEVLEGQAVVQSGPFAIHFVDTATYILQPGEAAEVAVRFTPPNEGQFPGSIVFTGRGIDSVARNLLGSTGPVDLTNASLNVYPNILQFGYTAVNSVKDLTITLQNPTTEVITGTVITPAPFSVLTSPDYALAPQSSTAVTIRFQPKTPATFNGVVTFSTSPHTVAVHGTSLQAVPATSLVFLNEVLPWNTYGICSADSTFSDWIELYNANQFAVDIAGWGLRTQPGSQTNDYTFPSTVIAPNGYLVVFASTSPSVPGEAHTGFELDEAAGFHLGLYNSGGAATSTVSFPALEKPNWSYTMSTDLDGFTSVGASHTPTPGHCNIRAGGKALLYRMWKLHESAVGWGSAGYLLPKIVVFPPVVNGQLDTWPSGFTTTKADFLRLTEFKSLLGKGNFEVFQYMGHGAENLIDVGDARMNWLTGTASGEVEYCYIYDIQSATSAACLLRNFCEMRFVSLYTCSTGMRGDDWRTAFRTRTLLAAKSTVHWHHSIDHEYWFWSFIASAHTVESANDNAYYNLDAESHLHYTNNIAPKFLIFGEASQKLTEP